MNWLQRHLSYANVVGTLALFVALGGTSYAVIKVDSGEIVDNSVRSKDIRDRTLRGRDVRRNSVGGGVIKERSLARVPQAVDAERIGGKTAGELRVACPVGTVAAAAVCVESSGRSPESFPTAVNICERIRRDLPTLPHLDVFTRANGGVSPEGEWTSSVYLEPPPEASTFERLHALLLRGTGVVDHARVNAPNPHPFRCVALPSN